MEGEKGKRTSASSHHPRCAASALPAVSTGAFKSRHVKNWNSVRVICGYKKSTTSSTGAAAVHMPSTRTLSPAWWWSLPRSFHRRWNAAHSMPAPTAMAISARGATMATFTLA